MLAEDFGSAAYTGVHRHCSDTGPGQVSRDCFMTAYLLLLVYRMLMCHTLVKSGKRMWLHGHFTRYLRVQDVAKSYPYVARSEHKNII